MSFILDALRKSEHERQRQAGPSLAELPVARPQGRYALAWAIVAALLVLNLLALGYFLLRDDSPPSQTAAPSAQPVAPPAPAAAPAASVQAPPPGRPAIAMPATTTTLQSPVRPLTAEAGAQYDQPAPAHLDAPDAPDPTLLPDAPRAATVRPGPAPRATSRVTSEGVPSIDQLPSSATAGLPALNLDLHVYGPDASKRFVFINNRRYVEGSSTPEGVRIERITPDGVILDHRGTRFLLSRP